MKYYLEISDLDLNKIHAVDLVLENCEGCKFYYNEIVDIALDFEPGLVLGGHGIVRKIKSGYIKIAIDEKTKRFKDDIDIWDEFGQTIKKPYKEKIEKRLIGTCHICSLTITYKNYYWQETIDVPYEEGNEDEYGNADLLTCSSAKIDSDGNLIILMGELSEYKFERV
jgi:hypothetical protein